MIEFIEHFADEILEYGEEWDLDELVAGQEDEQVNDIWSE